MDIPILLYHDIGDVQNPWCVSPREFHEQMSFLKEQGYTTITLTHLSDIVTKEKSLSSDSKFVVITFDDARKGVYQHAFPVLRGLGFGATIFVVPHWIEHGAGVSEEYSPLMSWDEIIEMNASGFEIGSHTFSHQNLSQLDTDMAIHELDAAERVLAVKLGKQIEHFAYPYGEFTDSVVEIVKKRYTTAVTTRRGLDRESGIYARQPVFRGMALDIFAKLLQQPALSLCMIVKNEEQNIERCLQSVNGLVNEIIVVDTGSTDKTKEIAACCGARVFDFPWQNDFAAARNESLKHATSDWILILDADEMLAHHEHEKIREALHNWDILGYHILTRNYISDSSVAGWQPPLEKEPLGIAHETSGVSGWYPSLKVRLFQRSKKIIFSGAIHEMVDESIRAFGGKTGSLRVPVHHYGALEKSSVAKEEKLQRYVELSTKKIDASPSAKAYFELGVQYKELGQLERAEKMFHDSLSLGEESVLPRLNLAVVQQKQGKFDDAIQNFEIVIVRDSKNADAHFGLGFCFFKKEKFAEAREQFLTAVACKPRFVDAYVNLGAISEKLGMFDDAVTALKTALTLSPLHGRAHYNLGVVYEKMNVFELALHEYERARELYAVRREEIEKRIEGLRRVVG